MRTSATAGSSRLGAWHSVFSRFSRFSFLSLSLSLARSLFLLLQGVPSFCTDCRSMKRRPGSFLRCDFGQVHSACTLGPALGRVNGRADLPTRPRPPRPGARAVVCCGREQRVCAALLFQRPCRPPGAAAVPPARRAQQARRRRQRDSTPSARGPAGQCDRQCAGTQAQQGRGRGTAAAACRRCAAQSCCR